MRNWKSTDEDRAAASRYAAVIEWSDADGICVATVPDIPNLHTHGATREVAATAADDLTALWIAGARETEIPVPSPRYRQRTSTRRESRRCASGST
jgi:predicted RNase H-like HicB family nuclease